MCPYYMHYSTVGATPLHRWSPGVLHHYTGGALGGYTITQVEPWGATPLHRWNPGVLHHYTGGALGCYTITQVEPCSMVSYGPCRVAAYN